MVSYTMTGASFCVSGVAVTSYYVSDSGQCELLCLNRAGTSHCASDDDTTISVIT